uniref:Uncharacterized protein n=1 Tax=Timema douglasi TaxID=61478 RepID=A0A7R8VDF8_TIMDO|nr:unnamed protein product [Timema douglasi]
MASRRYLFLSTNGSLYFNFIRDILTVMLLLSFPRASFSSSDSSPLEDISGMNARVYSREGTWSVRTDPPQIFSVDGQVPAGAADPPLSEGGIDVHETSEYGVVDGKMSAEAIAAAAAGEGQGPSSNDSPEGNPQVTTEGKDPVKPIKRYEVAAVEFARVETPFIIGLWIFFASLAKIGAFSHLTLRLEDESPDRLRYGKGKR